MIQWILSPPGRLAQDNRAWDDAVDDGHGTQQSKTIFSLPGGKGVARPRSG